MPDSIAGLLDKADLAIAAAAQLAEESITSPIAAAAAMLRRRLDYPHDLLLVGVAGGTGSGKSSLVNAIAGSDIAVVGGLRPTTNRPLAVASARSSPRIQGYLTSLGIDDIAIADLPDWLSLIDLPDTDSVELSHRLQVESLIPRLDVIVWIVDPEKYRDASLHHGYLQALSAYADRFVFVLNQVDRLSRESRTLVLSDLRQALIDDGIALPVILEAAAAPSAGPPIGVQALIDQLRSRLASGVIGKALAGLDDAASGLVAALGPSALDFEARASDVMNDVARALAGDREAEATDRIVEFLEAIADEAGAVTGERLRAAAARVPRQVRRIAEDVHGRPDPSALDTPVGNTPSDDVDEGPLRAAISDLVVRPVRETLRQRAKALALATDLTLSVATVRSHLGV